MEWVKRLNESMDYLEEHLTEEIDYEQLGRIACCSARSEEHTSELQSQR